MSDDANEQALAETLTVAFMDLEIQHPSDWRSATERNRPYTGQPQTADGERGKTEVRSVTFRDLKDAFVIGLFLASDVPEDERGSVYALDLNAIDILAAFQNMACEVEKRMGIYPNVPPLDYPTESETG